MAAAVRHHTARENEVAEAVCQDVLASEPGNPDAHHLLAVILSQRGDQASAVRSVAKALKSRPGEPSFLNTLGNALHKQGRNREAIESFRKALKLKPAYVEGWNNLGLALQAGGDLSASLAAFRRSLALSPGYALAHNNLGNALVASGDLAAALESFDAAIQNAPLYHEAHSNRGNTLRLLGRESDALASYDLAVAIEPNDIAAVNNRAVLQLQRGEHALALLPLEVAAASHPNDRATRTHLGVAYAGLGRFDEAMRCFDAVIENSLEYAPAHYYRGHVLRATGHPDQAIAHYLVAIGHHPDYAEAFDGLAFTLVDTGRFDELEEIVEGIMAEQRLSAAQRGGMRVIRAITRWLANREASCKEDIEAACSCDDETVFPNAGMIGIYRQFLRLLLDYRRENPSMYAGEATRTLHVIGESHCLSAAWTTVQIAGFGYRVLPHLVMGAKAWHFASERWNDHKHNLRRIVEGMPHGSTAVFVFGEIDARIDDGIMRYVRRHPQADHETVALATVAGYVNHVVTLARTRGISPIFQGIPAPAIDYSTRTDTERDRHLYIVRFVNAAMKTLAGEHGCPFLDVFALSAGPDDMAHGRAHIDAYHLKPGCLGEALESAFPADKVLDENRELKGVWQ